MHILQKETALAFNDVIMLPQYSEIESRSMIDLYSTLNTRSGRKIKFSLPLISSPMDTVTGPEMCLRMWLNGGLGILHRFCTIENQVNMVKEAKAQHNCVMGAAIGANGDYIERCKALIKEGIDILCIDIAHGHSTIMREALINIRNIVGDDVHIMAGNVATKKAVYDLYEWGADSIRVGIGTGAACSTSMQTGHGLPLLQSLLDCKGLDLEKITLIADGGIKKSADIVKSLAAGASFCMLGSLLAGTKASPGECIQQQDGRRMKKYRGSASASAQKDAGKSKIYEEGVSALVPYTGKLENILENLENGIRSGLAYSGASNIKELRQKAVAVKITNEAYIQATPHILNK